MIVLRTDMMTDFFSYELSYFTTLGKMNWMLDAFAENVQLFGNRIIIDVFLVTAVKITDF